MPNIAREDSGEVMRTMLICEGRRIAKQMVHVLFMASLPFFPFFVIAFCIVALIGFDRSTTLME